MALASARHAKDAALTAPLENARAAHAPTPFAAHAGASIASESCSPLEATANERQGEDGRDVEDARATAGEEDPLEPLLRQADLLAPPARVSATSAAPDAAFVDTRARASLEELLPALVRRVAWSGDGRKGAIVLELGAGALEGATLLVEADEGRVRIHLSAPAGVDLDAWRARIGARLAARLLVVESISAE